MQIRFWLFENEGLSIRKAQFDNQGDHLRNSIAHVGRADFHDPHSFPIVPARVELARGVLL